MFRLESHLSVPLGMGWSVRRLMLALEVHTPFCLQQDASSCYCLLATVKPNKLPCRLCSVLLLSDSLITGGHLSAIREARD